MRLLTLDPSTTSTGWAVVETTLLPEERIIAHGQIRPLRKLPAKCRIITMGRKVADIAQQYSPGLIIIEEPDDQGIVGRTTGTQSLLAACTYFIIGRIGNGSSEILVVPVQAWKGSVPKEVIYRRLLARYGKSLPRGTAGQPWANDAVDAVGIADWYIRDSESIHGTAAIDGVNFYRKE